MCSKHVILQVKPQQIISIYMLFLSCYCEYQLLSKSLPMNAGHLLKYHTCSLLTNSWCYTEPWAHPAEEAPLWQSCRHDGIDSGLCVVMLNGDSYLNAFLHLCVFSITHSSFFSNSLCSFITCAPLHTNSLQISEDMVKTLHLLMLPRWSLCTFKFENTCCQCLIEFLMRWVHHLYL